MTHVMKLNEAPYYLIKSKKKTIELRLYDEKRRLININDTIIFKNINNNNTLEVAVKALHIYPSFEELYKHFDKISLGYLENEEANYKDMNLYYSEADILKYGVVGIQIELKGEKQNEE